MPKTTKWVLLFDAMIGLTFVLSSSAQVTFTTNPTPSVPTPESVLGHRPGDDFYLANYDESREYFRKLAASSNRVKLITVGKTTRGLDWEIAIISSPENLASLDKFKDISRRLADGRGVSATEAHELARQGKAIVHIDGGLHSTEVAGAQQSINLAYKLVSSQNDSEVDAILSNVILMLWPTLNPDGQNEVVGWYRKNLGTSFEVSPLPDLWQEYVGHDNNRDGYMNNMTESQDVTRAEIEWDPVIFYCHHQTAPFPTRIFIPPFVEPISSNIHPLMARWLNALGTDIAVYLDEHNMPGAVNRVGFDNWYPGFLDFTHIFRNSVSFFTETALFRYATPRFYPIDEFPKDQQGLRSEVFYSSPWKGGWWRLRDAVNYMEGASMAVLDTAAKYHEELLYNRYQAAVDNVSRFTREPPYAYVVPLEQRDLFEAATLVQKMMINGIEVQQAAKPFHANGREYAPGTWVILMDQPFAPLVKELFEPQHYPDLRETPTSPPKLPYDVTGWTLPMQMGVQIAPVLEPVGQAERTSLKKLDQYTAPSGSIDGTGSVFALSHRSNASFRALNAILDGGGRVSFGSSDSETPDGTETGAIFVTGFDRDKLKKVAGDNSLKLKAIASGPKDSVAVKKARVGLYRSWVANIDEGWTRWILENYGFAPVTLRNGDIQAGSLREHFDAIILPDAMPATIRNGFGPGSVPGMYTGGIGEVGTSALREFVQAGGTLITFNNASLFAIDDLGLPVKNSVAGLKDEEFFCSGCLLRVEVQESGGSAVWGLPHDPIVMFERGPAFETKDGFRGRILAAYPKEQSPLMSGYLLHPERIQGKAAAVEVQYGKGRVYLLGFRPQWRGQSHGTYKFFFNAIYESQGLSKPAPASVGGPKGHSEATPGKPASAVSEDIDEPH
jgi:Zinc carboxypeptidase